MDIDWIREHCLALPHTTEKVQWEDDLVFKIGEKMYAVVPLVPARVAMSFKCSPEEFADLIERPGVIPAPYLARAQWVALESHDALPRDEIKRLLSQSYSLVFAKLPKRAQAQLTSPVYPDEGRARARKASRPTFARHKPHSKRK
jgi:predicted DNA-binding protein (MmcQ/YjbR family)